MDINTCAECDKSLTDLNIRHGWVTVQAGWKQARVHTLCRAKFTARPLVEQQTRAS